MAATMDVSELVQQMSDNLAAIHTTIASLSTTEHEAKLDELEQKRDTLLSDLKNEFDTEQEELAAKRKQEEDEIAEKRRLEDEEREARRKKEDEELSARNEGQDAERQTKYAEETRRVEEEADEGLDGVEEEIQKILEEGQAKLRELEEKRKEINRLIDERVSTPLPTVVPRKRARDKTAPEAPAEPAADAPADAKVEAPAEAAPDAPADAPAEPAADAPAEAAADDKTADAEAPPAEEPPAEAAPAAEAVPEPLADAAIEPLAAEAPAPDGDKPEGAAPADTPADDAADPKENSKSEVSSSPSYEPDERGGNNDKADEAPATAADQEEHADEAGPSPGDAGDAESPGQEEEEQKEEVVRNAEEAKDVGEEGEEEKKKKTEADDSASGEPEADDETPKDEGHDVSESVGDVPASTQPEASEAVAEEEPKDPANIDREDSQAAENEDANTAADAVRALAVPEPEITQKEEEEEEPVPDYYNTTSPTPHETDTSPVPNDDFGLSPAADEGGDAKQASDEGESRALAVDETLPGDDAAEAAVLGDEDVKTEIASAEVADVHETIAKESNVADEDQDIASRSVEADVVPLVEEPVETVPKLPTQDVEGEGAASAAADLPADDSAIEFTEDVAAKTEEVDAEEEGKTEAVIVEPVVEEAVPKEPVIEEQTIKDLPVEEARAKNSDEHLVLEAAAAEESSDDKPAADGPSMEQPVVEAADQPAAEPAAEEPAAEEPAKQESAVEEPPVQKSAVDSSAEAPSLEVSSAQESTPELTIEAGAVEEAAVEVSSVKDLTIEEVPVQESALEPAVEAASVEEPAKEEADAEVPAAEEPAVEEPSTKEPAAEIPVEEPAPEEASVQEQDLPQKLEETAEAGDMVTRSLPDPELSSSQEAAVDSEGPAEDPVSEDPAQVAENSNEAPVVAAMDVSPMTESKDAEDAAIPVDSTLTAERSEAEAQIPGGDSTAEKLVEEAADAGQDEGEKAADPVDLASEAEEDTNVPSVQAVVDTEATSETVPDQRASEELAANAEDDDEPRGDIETPLTKAAKVDKDEPEVEATHPTESSNVDAEDEADTSIGLLSVKDEVAAVGESAAEEPDLPQEDASAQADETAATAAVAENIVESAPKDVDASDEGKAKESEVLPDHTESPAQASAEVLTEDPEVSETIASNDVTKTVDADAASTQPEDKAIATAHDSAAPTTPPAAQADDKDDEPFTQIQPDTVDSQLTLVETATSPTLTKGINQPMLMSPVSESGSSNTDEDSFLETRDGGVLGDGASPVSETRPSINEASSSIGEGRDQHPTTDEAPLLSSIAADEPPEVDAKLAGDETDKHDQGDSEPVIEAAHDGKEAAVLDETPAPESTTADRSMSFDMSAADESNLAVSERSETRESSPFLNSVSEVLAEPVEDSNTSDDMRAFDRDRSLDIASPQDSTVSPHDRDQIQDISHQLPPSHKDADDIPESPLSSPLIESPYDLEDLVTEDFTTKRPLSPLPEVDYDDDDDDRPLLDDASTLVNGPRAKADGPFPTFRDHVDESESEAEEEVEEVSFHRGPERSSPGPETAALQSGQDARVAGEAAGFTFAAGQPDDADEWREEKARGADDHGGERDEVASAGVGLGHTKTDGDFEDSGSDSETEYERNASRVREEEIRLRQSLASRPESMSPASWRAMSSAGSQNDEAEKLPAPRGQRMTWDNRKYSIYGGLPSRNTWSRASSEDKDEQGHGQRPYDGDGAAQDDTRTSNRSWTPEETPPPSTSPAARPTYGTPSQAWARLGGQDDDVYTDEYSGLPSARLEQPAPTSSHIGHYRRSEYTYAPDSDDASDYGDQKRRSNGSQGSQFDGYNKTQTIRVVDDSTPQPSHPTPLLAPQSATRAPEPSPLRLRPEPRPQTPPARSPDLDPSLFMPRDVTNVPWHLRTDSASTLPSNSPPSPARQAQHDPAIRDSWTSQQQPQASPGSIFTKMRNIFENQTTPVQGRSRAESSGSPARSRPVSGVWVPVQRSRANTHKGAADSETPEERVTLLRRAGAGLEETRY